MTLRTYSFTVPPLSVEFLSATLLRSDHLDKAVSKLVSSVRPPGSSRFSRLTKSALCAVWAHKDRALTPQLERAWLRQSANSYRAHSQDQEQLQRCLRPVGLPDSATPLLAPLRQGYLPLIPHVRLPLGPPDFRADSVSIAQGAIDISGVVRALSLAKYDTPATE